MFPLHTVAPLLAAALTAAPGQVLEPSRAPRAAEPSDSVRGRQARGELLLTVEPVAGGVQYLHFLGGRWHLGAVVSGGPVYGAWLSDRSDIRDVAAAFPVVAVDLSPALRLAVSPVGAAAVIGNDFGTVYPAAQTALEVVAGRLRLGSVIRVIRVAGGGGTGDYRVRWIPIRVGLAFGS